MLLDCGALTCQTWKLDGHPDLLAHENPSEGLGASQLLKAYGEERASLCYNWNPTSSSANTSCLKRLVPIFTGHICWELQASLAHIFSYSHLHNVWCHQGKTKTLTPHCWWSGIPSSILCTCLPVLTLALHKVHVLACIAQHLLAKLAGNLVICQWEEEQLVSNTDVICATPCSAETKNSSMHALLTLVLERGMKKFTLSGRCESQSTSGGRSSFHLVIQTT